MGDRRAREANQHIRFLFALAILGLLRNLVKPARKRMSDRPELTSWSLRNNYSDQPGPPGPGNGSGCRPGSGSGGGR
jgi:hypothetical protein